MEVQDYRAASNTANASASALTARQDGPTMTMPTALSVPAKHSTRRVLLRPSAVTFMADVQAFHVGNGGPLNDEQMLELEGRLLVDCAWAWFLSCLFTAYLVMSSQLHTEPDVCLDPRPAVARLANIVEYNKRKFHAVVKWRRRAAAVADLEIDASSASAGGSVGSVKMDAAAEQERLMTMIAGATRAQQEAHGRYLTRVTVIAASAEEVLAQHPQFQAHLIRG